MTALATVGSPSCTDNEQTGGQPCVVTVNFRSDRTRGGIDPQDDRINDVNLYLYKDGFLDAALYVEGGSAVVALEPDRIYGVYALANVGRVDPPMHESDIPKVRTRIDEVEDMAGGLPMSYYGPGAMKSSAGGTFTLALSRLVSRWNVRFNPEVDLCSFEVQSVRIRQAAMDVTPFAPYSVPERVSDGDASSEEDLTSLQNGGSVSFYTLENAAGVLLPQNSDPWMKVPSEMDGEAGRCTYISISGRWTTVGAGCDLSLNFYLGRDNCTDFNVLRNTDYTIEVTISDKSTIRDSWKVLVEDFDERRHIIIEDDVLEVRQGHFWASTGVSIEPEGVPCTFTVTDSAALDAAGLRICYDGKSISALSSFVGEGFPQAEAVVSSWDGRVSDTLTLRVMHDEGDYTGYVYDEGKYLCRLGHIAFPDAGEDLSVTFPGGYVWRWDDFPVVLSYCIADTCDFTYFKTYNPPQVWFWGEDAEKSTELILSSGGRTARLRIGDLTMPGIRYEEPYVRLLDDKGRPMDIDDFLYDSSILNTIGMDALDSTDVLFNCLAHRFGVEGLPEGVTYKRSVVYDRDVIRHNSVSRIVFPQGTTGRKTPVKIWMRTRGGYVASTYYDLRL